MGFQFEWEYLEDVEHFPSQKDHGKPNDHNSEDFAEVKAVPGSFKTPQSKSNDIESCESEYDSPQNVVDIFLFVRILKNKSECRLQEKKTIDRPSV